MSLLRFFRHLHFRQGAYESARITVGPYHYQKLIINKGIYILQITYNQGETLT